MYGDCRRFACIVEASWAETTEIFSMTILRRQPVPVTVLSTFLIFLFVWAGMALKTQAGTPNQDLLKQVQVFRLENGIQVVLAPASGSGLSTVNVWVGAGSAHDPPGRQGLAHYFEHMVFKGSERYPGQAGHWVESRGGYINATTSLDYTEYHVVIPSEHTQLAIDLLADLVTRRDFSHQEMETERSVVLREWDRREDIPGLNLRINTRLALLGSHPFALPIVGTTESINSITRTDLVQWAERFYIPDNMTIVVVGDGDHNSLLDQIKTSFGAIASGPLPFVAMPELVKQEGYRQHTLEYTGELERLALAWAVPALHDLEELATKELLAYLLALELDYEYGRTKVAYDPTLSPGLFLLEFEFPSDIDSDEIRNDILADLEFVLSGHVHRAHIALAKKWLTKDLISKHKTGIEFANQLGLFAIATGDPLDAFSYIDQVQRVGKRQLLAMAREVVPVESRLEFRLVAKDDEAGEWVAAFSRPNLWETWQQSSHLMLDDLHFVASSVGNQLSVRMMRVVAWIWSKQWEMSAASSKVREEGDLLVLDNGMRMLLLPDTSTEWVEVHVLVGTGVGVETADEAGIARFTNEFMLYSLDDDHYTWLDASSSTDTGFDSTSLTLMATSTSWPAALPPFLEYITEPEWIRGHMESFQERVVQKIRARDEVPFIVARLQLRASLFGKGGYANPRTGRIGTVSSISINDMSSFHREFYVPENMVVVAAGNFDPKLMRSVLSRTLGRLKASAGLSEFTPVEAASKLVGKLEPDSFASLFELELTEATLKSFDLLDASAIASELKPGETSQKPVREMSRDWPGIQLAWVMIGFPGPGLTDDDFATFRIFNSVVGRGSSSRMFSHFREHEGKAYDVQSYVRGLRHTSFMNLYAQVLPEDRTQFVETAVAEISEIAEGQIFHQELQAAIAREVGAYLISREWIGNRAIALGQDVLYGVRYEGDCGLIQQMEDVSVHDISEMAKKLLNQIYISEIVPEVGP